MSRLPLLVLLLLVACSGPLVAQSPTSPAPPALASLGSTEIRVPLVSGTFSIWTGGRLVVLEYMFSDFPRFRFVDREGIESLPITLTLPDAYGISLHMNSIARGPDGALAVIGHAWFTDTQSGSHFLAWLSPDGQVQKVVRLSPFRPEAVTMAADGNIWVAGYVDPEIPGQYDRNQDLIRRYDREGKLLGTFVRWSSLEIPPRSVPPDTSSMFVSSPDRVGWYSPVTWTYVEFSLDGSMQNRVKAPQGRSLDRHPMLHVGLCDDNSLFLSVEWNNGPNQKAHWGIYALNREKSEWNYIPRPQIWGKLFGCDGTRLATTTDHRLITWLAPTGQ